jgi:hypothetical protein
MFLSLRNVPNYSDQCYFVLKPQARRYPGAWANLGEEGLK